MMVIPTPAAAQSRPELGRPGAEPVETVAGEVLVQFRPGARGLEIAAAHRQNGGVERERIAGIDVRVVEVPPGQERVRAAAYRANPNVQFAEVNGLYYAIAKPAAKPTPAPVPTEADNIAKQWQYNNTGVNGIKEDADIDAFEAWASGATGASSVRVAVLDTGIDLSHEDLQGQVPANGSANFTNSRTLDDLYGHGTHVAGSVAAKSPNGIGVSGTCPKCSVLNVKVLGDNGSGSWSGIANGIVWAADHGAQVINMSLGSYAASQTVEQAVQYARASVGANGQPKKPALIAAAAGNDGGNLGLFPAAYSAPPYNYDNVIPVGATDSKDEKASFSNFGGNWVKLAAPGVSILSTATDHRSTLFPTGPKYATLSGTSMATPHVAGVAALVISRCPNLSYVAVIAALTETADTVPGTGSAYTDYWIYGRVNANRAVASCSP
jgi:thermitase